MDTRIARSFLVAVAVTASVSGPMAAPVGATPGPANPDSVVSSAPPVTPVDIEFDRTASTDELLESAREMFLADNYVLAEMLYKSILVRDPNHLFAMQELAIVYEATGKLQYAQGLLSRAATLKPYDQEIINKNNRVTKKLSKSLAAEIDSLIAETAYDMALPKLAVLLTTQPENADLYYKKALCHFELDDPVNTRVAIDKAIELRNDPRYYDLRSQAHSLSLDGDIGALAREVRACMITGNEADRDRARALVSRILELDPDNEWGQRYFLALTTGAKGIPSPTAKDANRSGFDRLATRVGPTVGVTVRAVSDTLNSHLDVLLYILIALIIFGSPLTFMVVRGFSPRQSLSGQLNQFNIREILAVIQSQNRTGVLKIKSSGASGRVFFGSGEVYHCTCGRRHGRDALKHLIERAVDGYFVFNNSKRKFRTSINVPLSLILMDLPAREKPVVSKGL
ncbi:MAG: DUF4388 domain-containing protein, partial [Candidatus Latescibacterota bacterium]